MASSLIGALRVSMGMDSAEFSKGVAAAKASLGKLGASFAKFGAVTAAGMSAAFAGFSVAMKSIASDADMIAKSSQKLGIASDELQKLRYTADLSGVSFEGLSKGVLKLTQSMSDVAKGGTSDAVKAFKALGINVKNADGGLKSQSKVLEEVADKFASYRDGAEKTALALAIFGKAGADLIPFLNQGSEAIRRSNAEAKEFGITMSERLQKSSEQFNDNMSRLGSAMRGFWVLIAEQVVPTLAMLSDKYIQAIKDSNLLRNAATAVVTAFKAVAGLLIVVARNMDIVVLSFAAFFAIKVAAGLIGITVALVKFVKGITLARIAMALFAAAARKKIVMILAIPAALAYLKGEYEDFSTRVKGFWGKLAALIPEGVLSAGGRALTIVGAGVSSLTKEFDALDKMVDKAAISKPAAPTLPGKPAKGGGGKAKGEKEEKLSPWQKLINNAKRYIETQDALKNSLGRTAEAAEQLKFKQDLLNKAGAAGIAVTPLQSKALDDLSLKMAKAKVAAAEAKANFEFAKGATLGFIQTLRQGLVNGEKFWKSFGNAALSVLNKIIDKIEKQLVDALFSLGSAGGGGGGIFGAIFRGIGSAFGGGGGGGGGGLSPFARYAQGGQFKVGGSGGIDSQFVGFHASPNETVTVAKPGQTFGGGKAGPQLVTVRGVFVDDGGVIKARVDSSIRDAAPAIVGASVKQTEKAMPGMLRNVQTRAG